jgi:2-(1,2-epoxy-1,2-dihydrophenyl)acetyl-CoA isomerase
VRDPDGGPLVSTDEKTLLLDVEGGVATLTLNRPEAGNQFETAMAADLLAAAEEVAGRDDVRVVVLRGAGKVFCFGGDVAFMAGSDDPRATLDVMSEQLHAAVLALSSGDAPIVAVVQGPAMGVGLSLVAIADVVLAGASAKFMAGYSNVGLTPDGGMTWTLPRKVGIARATDMLLRNPTLDAEAAREAGIVTEVLADDELQDRATKVIGQLAQGPTQALGAIRGLLRGSLGATLGEQLDAERASLLQRVASDEAREGMTAFAERRRPSFAGDPAEAGR